MLFDSDDQVLAHVEQRRRLGRRPSRREVEASLVGLRDLARTLGQVQHTSTLA
jgi:hypothetical protein